MKKLGFRIALLSFSLIVVSGLLAEEARRVQLSEIMLNPLPDSPLGAYIELYQPTTYEPFAGQYKVVVGPDTFTFAAVDNRSFLMRQEDRVLLVDLDHYEKLLFADSPLTRHDRSRACALKVLHFSIVDLSDKQEIKIELLDTGGERVDSVTCPANLEPGVSWEWTRDGVEPVNGSWGPSQPGGTGGEVVQTGPREIDLDITHFLVEPAPLSDSLLPGMNYEVTVQNTGLWESWVLTFVGGGRWSDTLAPGQSITHGGFLDIPVDGWYSLRARIIGRDPQERYPAWLHTCEKSVKRIQKLDVDGDQVNLIPADSLRADPSMLVPLFTRRSGVHTPSASFRFSELMSNPTKPGGDWFEMTNRHPMDGVHRTIRLHNHWLHDQDDNWYPFEEVSDQRLGDRRHLQEMVVTHQPTETDQAGISQRSQLVQPEMFHLRPEGGRLELYNSGGNLVDAVVYGPSPQGTSLVRTSYQQEPAVEDWLPSKHPSGSTPALPEYTALPGLDLKILGLDHNAHWIVGDGSHGDRHYYSLKMELIGTGEHPDSINVLVWNKQVENPIPAKDYEYIRTIALPEGPGEFDCLIDSSSIEPGPWTLTATLLVDDRNNSNNQLKQTYRFPYSRRRYYDSHGSRITEVMSHPGMFGSGEWVEMNFDIYPAIDFSGWSIENEKGERSYVPQLPFPRYRNSSYVVFAQDSTALAEWPRMDTSTILPCSTWAAIGNSGDSLTIYDGSGTRVASVRIGKAKRGRSLVWTYEREVNHGWSPSLAVEHGSPGQVNQTHKPDSRPSWMVDSRRGTYKVDGPHYITHGMRETHPLPTINGSAAPPPNEHWFTFYTPPRAKTKATIVVKDLTGNPLAVIFKGRVNHEGKIRWDETSGLEDGPLPKGLYLWEGTIKANGSEWTSEGLMKIGW